MKHGIVTSVDYSSEGHVFATVQSSRAGVTYPKVPLAQKQPGDIQSIEEGYHVALERCDDGLWIVVGVLNSNPDLAPTSLDANERVIRFDDGTEITARQDGSGGYDVNIEASGDLTINATGNVTIGDSANAVKLAVQNHEHDVSLSDGSTATTSKPNQSGTDAKVE